MMESNDTHDPSEHASTSLKVILLVFALVLVGTLGYLVWDSNRGSTDVASYAPAPTTSDRNERATTGDSVEQTTTKESRLAEVTKDWQTLTVEGITLKVPKNWSYKDRVFTAVPDTINTLIYTTTKTELTSISEGPKTDLAYIETIERIHLNRSVANEVPTPIPSSMQPIWGWNDRPTVYVESEDGSWRGAAFLGLEAPSFTDFLTIFTVLTNGKGSFVTIRFSAYSVKSSTYDCLGSRVGEMQACINEFINYLEPIRLDMNNPEETLIKEWQSTLQYVVRSIK